jgi:23S rRNA (adenine2503-C2)-methyltransferase
MGDAGRNLNAVSEAVYALADRDRFCMAQSKLTVSTVGPSPEIFQLLADLPCTIAWSLHAADDKLRKLLVPSTKHTTIELRNGLIYALSNNIKSKVITIAITLINDINIPGFERPSRDRINAFQEVLRDQGYFCSVRVTRGDEEASACGMLATKRMKTLQ